MVGKFVEFFGDGVAHLSLADRATVANMCPEYGATVGFFPVDARTMQYVVDCLCLSFEYYYIKLLHKFSRFLVLLYTYVF